MGLSAPQSLDASHRLEEFDCGKPALTDWLLHHARQAQSSGSARTFVVCDEKRVAGYCSLTVGQIDTLEAPDRIRRGMGQYPNQFYAARGRHADSRDLGAGHAREGKEHL